MSRADEPFDPVQKPRHYNSHPSGIECIELVHYLPFAAGNAIKYMFRAGLKDGAATLVDLAKAEWYLRYAIKHNQHWVLHKAYIGGCEDTMRKIVEHHNAEIGGAIQHVVEACLCLDGLKQRETLLELALKELQIEIMRQQHPIVDALEDRKTILLHCAVPGAVVGIREEPTATLRDVVEAVLREIAAPFPSYPVPRFTADQWQVHDARGVVLDQTKTLEELDLSTGARLTFVLLGVAAGR